MKEQVGAEQTYFLWSVISLAALPHYDGKPSASVEFSQTFIIISQIKLSLSVIVHLALYNKDFCEDKARITINIVILHYPL